MDLNVMIVETLVRYTVMLLEPLKAAWWGGRTCNYMLIFVTFRNDIAAMVEFA